MIVIESRQNATIKHLIRLGKEKKYRYTCGEMVCEGEKMLEEAMQSNILVKTVLVRQPIAEKTAALLSKVEMMGARIYAASEPIYRQASGVETPQGVIFSCRIPEPTENGFDTKSRVLILDGVQDPGNMGTILRTADAFALDAVVLAEGCTDPTAPKVVRSTMGAAFRMPIVRIPILQAIAQLKEANIPVYAAALTSEAISVRQVDLHRSAIVIGSEGHGVSKETLQHVDQCIILPMEGSAESLNAGVAASILMWEMTKG